MTDHIASTASITLITGLPGSGKSLRAVKFIREASEAGELIHTCNFSDLKISTIPIKDPREWRDLPAGSILVVDEAQEFFRTRRGGEAPEYITAMERIRHHGVRLVLLTQQPDYLDTHLRGLCGLHEHLLRINGKQAAKIWRHNEVMDNVRSERARARYDSETWEYPKELFELYTSAQVHTVKSVMSSKWKRGLAFMAAAAVVLGFVGWQFGGFFTSAASTGDLRAVAADAAPRGVAPAERPDTATHQRTAMQSHEPDAVAEYMANLTARTPSLPWSAPIYDGRAAVAEPRVFCMASGDGLDGNGQWKAGGYHCVTEQGTRVVMDERQARAIARWGEPYNPFRNPAHQQPQQGQQPPEETPARRSDRPVALLGSAGTVGAPAVAPEFGTITRPQR